MKEGYVNLRGEGNPARELGMIRIMPVFGHPHKRACHKRDDVFPARAARPKILQKLESRMEGEVLKFGSSRIKLSSINSWDSWIHGFRIWAWRLDT